MLLFVVQRKQIRRRKTEKAREQTGEKWWNRITTTNASLFVINLSDNSIRASVEGFAPEGEEVASVRFEGDKLYVCTAVIRLFSDPVFFFDLSDYENITYTDTGYIEGFSSSLINLGEGYLLGIGNEDSMTGKIEGNCFNFQKLSSNLRPGKSVYNSNL